MLTINNDFTLICWIFKSNFCEFSKSNLPIKYMLNFINLNCTKTRQKVKRDVILITYLQNYNTPIKEERKRGLRGCDCIFFFYRPLFFGSQRLGQVVVKKATFLIQITATRAPLVDLSL